METQKIKRYRLSISRVFPVSHVRKGNRTGFIEAVKRAIYGNSCSDECIGYSHIGRCYVSSCEGKNGNKKLHTIRGNYDRWVKIMDEVREGKAVIELFYWDGKPYGKGVKQVVFAILDENSGCGVQKLDSVVWQYAMIKRTEKTTISVEIEELAKNDGLFVEDFAAWFKGTDLSKPLAIIQFTDFRY